jgi:hypothetical protein
MRRSERRGLCATVRRCLPPIALCVLGGMWERKPIMDIKSRYINDLHEMVGGPRPMKMITTFTPSHYDGSVNDKAWIAWGLGETWRREYGG